MLTKKYSSRTCLCNPCGSQSGPFLPFSMFGIFYCEERLGLSPAAPFPTVAVLLAAGLLLRQFVLDVLLQHMRIRPHNPPPIHKNRRRAPNLQVVPIGDAGVNIR